jgi:hypothetical protein
MASAKGTFVEAIFLMNASLLWTGWASGCNDNWMFIMRTSHLSEGLDSTIGLLLIDL